MAESKEAAVYLMARKYLSEKWVFSFKLMGVLFVLLCMQLLFIKFDLLNYKDWESHQKRLEVLGRQKTALATGKQHAILLQNSAILMEHATIWRFRRTGNPVPSSHDLLSIQTRAIAMVSLTITKLSNYFWKIPQMKRNRSYSREQVDEKSLAKSSTDFQNHPGERQCIESGR